MPQFGDGRVEFRLMPVERFKCGPPVALRVPQARIGIDIGRFRRNQVALDRSEAAAFMR
jgi:hypothetical protein